MKRRDFLANTSLFLGSLPLLNNVSAQAGLPNFRDNNFNPNDWPSVRKQFSLTTSRIHLATFLLASHPKPVAEAIERHRREFDNDPVHHWHEHFMTAEPAQRAAAAEYLGTNPDHIALTDSTTMGLSIIYGTIKLDQGEEILTTTHDHYATEMSLRHRAERTGATVRQISLYDEPEQANTDEIISRMLDGIRDNTKVFAVTWVHSSTGVKLPIAAMAQALKQLNSSHAPEDRVLFCVDGVHGLGIENVKIEELGCDFFMAGTHKWIFGPRGTGIVWGRPEAWKKVSPVIPGFGMSYGAWLGAVPLEAIPVGDHMSPGGFHSFEHRWALEEAFKFHMSIGKQRIQDRIHSLNTLMKEGLAEMSHVELRTPMDSSLSSGLVCFDIKGHSADEVVNHLMKRDIVASSTPYRVTHARFAPSVINNEDEIQQALEAVRALG